MGNSVCIITITTTLIKTIIQSDFSTKATFAIYIIYLTAADRDINVAEILKYNVTLGTLQKSFSGQHFEICFLIFSRKHVLTFHANCLHWTQFA